MNDTKVRRPLRVLSSVAEHLARILAPACARIEVAGSIRRLRPEVADIELVAIPKIESYVKPVPGLFGEDQGEEAEHNFLWAALEGLGDRVQWIRRGEKARAFWYPLEEGGGQVQVDLYTACPENWGLILLIRTGSDKFSRDIVTRLARARRPSFEGWVRDASRTPPKNITPQGMPEWSDAEKARMHVLPTPEESDVFRLALCGQVEPANRSW